ncbi:MAG: hypothetical protein NZ527_06930 [Hydrogenobacter thermophilus]|uniref:hypothetical protein n=1 Tax=Hydrogenobacter thermophilus TaxID=940 RepID=UPI001C796EE1|nr:hypothetical protein [Hydrogenobacter thermophilus]MCS7285437.1 hypothetical protein [Hydrogenobacter thermophilus]QWK19331.1 MAG: hypothetical protein KNN13_07460 [Hydrogenobacter thermophilus]
MRGYLLLLAGLGSLVALYALSTKNPIEKSSSSWGSEALVENKPVEYFLEHHVFIPLANACGLGATSCFKCHNGQRAEAPAPKPWHTDHAKVNFSCNGCHKGNPRLIKKELAHTKMIPNPLTEPSSTCASCHMGQNIGELVKKYEAVKKQSYKPNTELLGFLVHHVFSEGGR